MAPEFSMKALWQRASVALRTALRPTLLQARTALWHFWSQRTVRERLVLGILGVLLLATLWIEVVYAPAQGHIIALQQQLRAMHSEQAQLQAMAAEWKAMRSPHHQAPVPAPQALEPLLRQALQSLGQDHQGLSTEGHGQFVLDWKAAPFSALVDWLDQVRRNARVVVLQAHVEPTAKTGEVNAHLVLKAGDAP